MTFGFGLASFWLILREDPREALAWTLLNALAWETYENGWLNEPIDTCLDLVMALIGYYLASRVLEYTPTLPVET